MKTSLEKNITARDRVNKVVNALDLVAKISKTRTYECIIEAYLKDSDAYGNVYFSNYFIWQGICREKWFSECIFGNMLTLDYSFITKTAHMEYKNEAFPFQKIRACLNIGNFKRVSVDVVIKFYEDISSTLLAEGYQTIVFVNKNKRISKLDDSIKNKMLEYLI